MSAMGTEKTLRRDVALANRILERVGLSDAFGHVSARIPGTRFVTAGEAARSTTV